METFCLETIHELCENSSGNELNVPTECHLVDLERHSYSRSDANAIIRLLPSVSNNKKRKSSSVLMKCPSKSIVSLVLGSSGISLRRI